MPLLAGTDGQSLVQNVSRLAAARGDRVRTLSTALSADSARTGAVNQVDTVRLRQEQAVAEQTASMAALLGPLAATISPEEGAAVMAELSKANQTGSFDTASLGRVIAQIRGSAANLPATYLASSSRGFDVLARESAATAAAADQVQASANQTGVIDRAALQRVSTQQEREVAITGGLETQPRRCAHRSGGRTGSARRGTRVGRSRIGARRATVGDQRPRRRAARSCGALTSRNFSASGA